MRSEFGIEFVDQSHLHINKGDTLTIKAQGITVTGKVVESDNFDRDGWYIELTDANVPGGYSYWKQGQDGGKITHINGSEARELKAYYDMYRTRILPGMKLRHENGEEETVYECGDNDLGFNATNPNYAHDTEQVYYPLSEFNLRKWAIIMRYPSVKI